jgi:hypothetical protein
LGTLRDFRHKFNYYKISTELNLRKCGFSEIMIG